MANRTPMARDLTGRVYGRLTVVGRDGRAADRTATWRCRCTCGGERVARTDCLRKGTTVSCGCARIPAKQLAGQTFGWWTALERIGRRSGHMMWRCRCRCGTVREVQQMNLTRGMSTSCGCRYPTLQAAIVARMAA